MRKNFRTVLLLLTITTAMWIFTGCGDKGQVDDVLQTEQTAGQSDQSVNADDVTGEANLTDEETDEPQDPDATEDNSTKEDAGTSTSSTEELSVYVESVGDNSVVGNMIYTEPGIVEGSEIAVVGAGEDNKTLLSVKFDDNASYIYRIIRDGGANVETHEGGFSDIKEGFILNMTGRYEGGDFWAEEVEIHEVRND